MNNLLPSAKARYKASHLFKPFLRKLTMACVTVNHAISVCGVLFFYLVVMVRCCLASQSLLLDVTMQALKS